MRILVLLIVAAALSLGMAACRGSQDEDDSEELQDLGSTPVSTQVAAGAAIGTTVNVAENEYSLRPGLESVPPGDVTFVLNNAGTMAHQFIVIATDLSADGLPLNENTGQADIESAELEVVLSQEAFPPGPGPSMAISMAPGHYVLICNISGHYQQGMRFDFVVEEG